MTIVIDETRYKAGGHRSPKMDVVKRFRFSFYLADGSYSGWCETTDTYRKARVYARQSARDRGAGTTITLDNVRRDRYWRLFQ
jgi:hypothetical protein